MRSEKEAAQAGDGWAWLDPGILPPYDIPTWHWKNYEKKEIGN